MGIDRIQGCFRYHLFSSENFCKKYLTFEFLNINFTTDGWIDSRKVLVILSYFTLVLPLLITLILLAVIFLKIICTCFSKTFPSPTLETSSVEESLSANYINIDPCARGNIKLTESGKEKLIRSLQNEPISRFFTIDDEDLNVGEGDIEWLSRDGRFRHKNISGITFKIPLEKDFSYKRQKQEVKRRANFSNKCWEVCQEEGLGLLEVAKVGAESLGSIHGCNRYVFIEEELDFNPNPEYQSILREDLLKNSLTAKQLETVEEQIMVFEFRMKYSIIKRDRFPILNRASGGEHLRCAIFNFDEFE